ncbi:uncharacterized protein LOC106669427 [Cimex lectularius]|uniref:BTB domain-containing protein n=1 Tax=Cimex lectularius TaxID=79782 RepID=A0A8I6RZA9_CIMLE|nr:uncharacterized protein LOC106669427 [Cimex lectularius]
MEVEEEKTDISDKGDATGDEDVSKKETVSKEKLNIVLNKLRSSSSKDIFRALHYIRNRVINKNSGINAFHQCGGIKQLMKMLSSNNEDIQSLVLSILGNCCCHLIKNETFCDELLINGLPEKLTVLLKKTINAKIHRRVCRLIGNMAQSHRLARELHKSNISLYVVPILRSAECIELQQTAITAIKWLWKTDKYHYEMLRIAAVKTVASYLDTENEQLLKTILQTLVVFTQPCVDLTALQITGNGNGYVSIVSKINLPIVRVLICNLSHSPPARVELSKAGVVPSIIDRLEGGGKIDSYLITSLCLLCRESMIRASLRKTPSGFKTILSLLMNPKAKPFYLELLSAISQFNYDKPSLIIMIKGGLINVLVERLSEYTKAYGSPHQESVPASVAPMSPSSPSSPWSSPSSPPMNATTSDSGMYSPRCITPDSDSGSSSPYVHFPKFYFDTYPEGHLGVDGCIVEILSQITYLQIPLACLASKTTINTFLDYMVGLKYPQSKQNYIKATKALSSIVRCKHYFNILLGGESILAIERSLCRALHPDCWECKRLRETGREVLNELGTAAQSGLGEGELTYRLATVSDNVRESVSLAIPHVIKQPNLLNSLLFGHNALKYLLDSLITRIDEAVPSLHNLFTSLSIKNPQVPFEICQQCEVASMRKESNISFSLDDGSRVMANKESLSHSCPVFEAMFRGGFVESKQSTVHITDMSMDCLSHLTRVINEYCSCVLPKDLSTLLEMITATDRFLLPDLTSKILSVVMNSTLSHSTCSAIYDWSVTIGQQLSIGANIPCQVIKYLFVADMPSSCRVNATRLILEGNCAQKFTQDLTDIIKTRLQHYTKNQRFINYKMV